MKRAGLLVMIVTVALVFTGTAGAAPTPNLIANPSAEVIDARTGLPQGWQTWNRGQNSSSFTVSRDAHQGLRSLKLSVTKYRSGDAGWYFAPLNVAPDTMYVFGDYYKASGEGVVRARFTGAAGQLVYRTLGTTPPSAEWTPRTFEFRTPAWATGVTVMHVLAGPGTLLTDDHRLVRRPVAAAGENMVPNSTVEEAASDGGPASWRNARWGVNDAVFEYLSPGYTSGHSLRVSMAQYSSGDAKWFFEPQPVTPGAYYRYSDRYIADRVTHVVAVFTDGAGVTTHKALPDAPVSREWARYSAGFSAPAGAVSATVYHLIAGVGTLTTDEFRLEATTAPRPFNRALLSITFDDGWATDHDIARPVLERFGLHATHYVITGSIDDTAVGYMTAEQVCALADAGEEIGSHTVTHPYLTHLSPSEQASELAGSRNALEGLLGGPVVQFALPYGDFDVQVMGRVRERYGSARTTIRGFNTPDIFDPYRIVVMPVDAYTRPETVRAWVDTAETNGYWLVLLFHRIDDSGGAAVTAADFEAMMAGVAESGIEVRTVGQALDELGSR